ncbi:helix-turn-helix domain-containing protein [Cupriavidus basilensis]
MDINTIIARRVREPRDSQGWSLDALAERSKVSHANISLIERGQSSPAAVVLDKLATALNVTLASLFEQSMAPLVEASPLSRAAAQSIRTDPAPGYVRRNPSPVAPSPIQLPEVNFPAGQRVTHDTGMRDTEIHQQVWVIEGAMQMTVGEKTRQLETGDCLAMRLDSPISYFNTTRKPARYLVALTTVAITDRRRHG